MGYSFTGFTSMNRGTNNKANDNKPKNPTQAQIKYYMDLCKQKRVVPENYLKMTYDEFADLIAKLKEYYPASESQIKMISEKIATLKELGVEVDEPNYSTLTGGRGGSASLLIEELIKKEKENSDKMIPTEQQLTFIVGMYLCPDIPFENFEITKKVSLGEGMWRKMTPDEFACEVASKMNKREASVFIDNFRGVFYEWKSTRISADQMRYIRQLEERLANISTPSIASIAVDENGDVEVVNNGKVTDKSKNWNPKGYEGLSEYDLLQFSIDDASNYINILKSELGRKELYSYRDNSDGSMTFEFMREKKRKAENPMDTLMDLMFKLEAVAGYENPDIHEAITPLLLMDDVDDESVAESKRVIREFMIYLVEEKFITFDSMIELCKDSDIAQKIMLGL